MEDFSIFDAVSEVDSFYEQSAKPSARIQFTKAAYNFVDRRLYMPQKQTSLDLSTSTLNIFDRLTTNISSSSKNTTASGGKCMKKWATNEQDSFKMPRSPPAEIRKARTHLDNKHFRTQESIEVQRDLAEQEELKEVKSKPTINKKSRQLAARSRRRWEKQLTEAKQPRQNKQQRDNSKSLNDLEITSMVKRFSDYDQNSKFNMAKKRLQQEEQELNQSNIQLISKGSKSMIKNRTNNVEDILYTKGILRDLRIQAKQEQLNQSASQNSHPRITRRGQVSRIGTDLVTRLYPQKDSGQKAIPGIREFVSKKSKSPSPTRQNQTRILNHSISERSLDWTKSRNLKIGLAKQEQSIKQLEECTFQPKVNAKRMKINLESDPNRPSDVGKFAGTMRYTPLTPQDQKFSDTSLYRPISPVNQTFASHNSKITVNQTWAQNSIYKPITPMNQSFAQASVYANSRSSVSSYKY